MVALIVDGMRVYVHYSYFSVSLVLQKKYMCLNILQGVEENSWIYQKKSNVDHSGRAV
jgi:hypothetical protein